MTASFLFKAFAEHNQKNEKLIPKALIFDVLEKSGIRKDDKRLASFFNTLKTLPVNLSEDDFEKLQGLSPALLEQILTGQLTIPRFDEFCHDLSGLYEIVKENRSGKLADYIPQLAKVDPEKFAVSICSVDGQRFDLGDFDDFFCVQSCSKPITYCLALEAIGEAVHKYVGAEPSGKTFNELTLNAKGQPHNPMINAGAIMCGALISTVHKDASNRFDYVMKMWKECAGPERIGFDNAVYLSEKQTADRNYALAYFMREKKSFPKGIDLVDILEFYFQCCSIELNTKAMAVVAATLANGGVCPLTGEQVFRSDHVKNCLSLMSSCGMYDFSGEFAFKVGIPAKSGVSGGIMLVVPNVIGMAIWSPRLDELGNSVRGVELCTKLTERFKFHTFDSTLGLKDDRKDPRRGAYESRLAGTMALCLAASEGDLTELRRLVGRGLDANACDYDGRTPLHLACAGGHIETLRFLISIGVDPNRADRFGNKPIDDARRSGKDEIISILQDYTNAGKRNI